VNLVLTAILHYDDEVARFGKEVLPLVRKLEAEGRGKDSEDEVRRTGEVYAKA
jgi:alkanesulfonate monooxygenase